MKNISTNNQRGSTHVVVIAVLIVIILGLVGYLFWNNFVAKKDSTNQSASTSTASKSSAVATSSPTATKSPDLTGYLVLDDWKVKFKLPSNSGEILYFSDTQNTDNRYDANYYGFTTKLVDALGDSCSKSTATLGPVIYLGTLRRTKNKIDVEGMPSGPYPLNNNQPINSYYYYVNNAQATCSENGSDLQVKGLAIIKELLYSGQGL